MGGVWLWVRSEWRRGWAGLLALGLLIALAGGVTLAVAAGARRADTAMDRFLAETNGVDIEVELALLEDPADIESRIASLPTAPELADRLERVPGVDGLTVTHWIAATPDPDGEFFNGGIGVQRGEAPTQLLVGGRWADPANPHEAVVGEAALDEWGIDLGDEVALHTLGPGEVRQWLGLEGGEPEGPVIDVRVVGAIRDIEEISDAPEPFLLVNQAFVDHYADEVLSLPGIVVVNAEPGGIDQTVARLQEAVGENYTVDRPEDFAGRIDDSVSVEVTALWAFAAAAAATGLVVLYLTMGRHVADLAGTRFIRRTLGFTGRDDVVGSVLRLAPAVLLGALGAVGLAVALSPLFPRGLARRADPSPGVLVDPLVLTLGALATVVLGVVLAAATGRSHRHSVVRGAAPPAPLDRVAESLSPSGEMGVRFALAPTGRLAQAGWAGIIGAAVAVAGVLAVAAVERSVERLMTTPRLYGAGWDAVLEIEPEEEVDAVVQSVASLPEVAGVGRKELLPGETEVEATGPGGDGRVEPEVFHAVAGAIAPTLTDGRLPGGPSEVAIGASVARRLGADVGDTVEVDGHRGPAAYEVVGRVVTPGADELGDGFVVTQDGLEALTLDCPASDDDPFCSPITTGIGVRFDPGVDESEAIARLAQIDDRWAPVELPSVIYNLGEIGSTPLYLAVFLGLLGVAGLAHAMMVGSGRRDHDLAVTRAVGLRPAQAGGAVRWQGLVLSMVGAVVGVLVGVIAGRVVWRQVAEGTGAVVETVIPVWVMLVAPAGILAIGLLVAGVPAMRAAIRRPAELLRTE